MAFSAKDQFLMRESTSQGRSTLDSSHNPSNKPFTYQSFTDAIKFQKRHAFNVTPDVDNTECFKTLTSNSTFIEAKEKNSIVIDCSQFLGMVFKDKTLLGIMREQYPNSLGMKPRIIGKNKRKVVELSFSTEKECKDALLKEFVVEGKAIEVSKTLTSTSQVIRVGITEIPLDDEDALMESLVKTFERYGDILNIGLTKVEDHDWFTGRGFVTLNRDKLKNYAADLTPQVQLIGYEGTALHLVWSNMKPICPECHSDDHIKYDCPKKQRKLCHRCRSPNHLQADCPAAPWNKKDLRNKETSKYQDLNDNGDINQAKSSGMEVNLLDALKGGNPNAKFTSNNTFEVLAASVEEQNEETRNIVEEENMEDVVTESAKGTEAETNEENTVIGTREEDVASELNEGNFEPNINEDDNVGVQINQEGEKQIQHAKKNIASTSRAPRLLRSSQSSDTANRGLNSTTSKDQLKPSKINTSKRRLNDAISPGSVEPTTPQKKGTNDSKVIKATEDIFVSPVGASNEEEISEHSD